VVLPFRTRLTKLIAERIAKIAPQEENSVAWHDKGGATSGTAGGGARKEKGELVLFMIP
jgi:hypothetical protein